MTHETQISDAIEAKEIFLRHLKELPKSVRRAVEFTLANWSELKIAEAKSFLTEFPSLLQSSQEFDNETRAKLSAAIDTLKNFPDVWLSLENLPNEIWRDVADYAGIYQVSNYGRVKSFRRGKAKIFRVSTDKDGYEIVVISRNGNSKNARVHNLVAQAFIANLDEKPFVHHRDNIKHNNCVWNLFWVTNQENVKYACEMGLNARGFESSLAKLTPEQVQYIRENYIPRHLARNLV